MPFTWRINITRNPSQPGPAIFEFDQQPPQVVIGDLIIWSNDDSVAHFPTPIDQSFVFMENQIAGKSTSPAFAPSAAGTINYVCSLHNGESGQIVVSATPSAVASASDGEQS